MRGEVLEVEVENVPPSLVRLGVGNDGECARGSHVTVGDVGCRLNRRPALVENVGEPALCEFQLRRWRVDRPHAATLFGDGEGRVTRGWRHSVEDVREAARREPEHLGHVGQRFGVLEFFERGHVQRLGGLTGTPSRWTKPSFGTPDGAIRIAGSNTP